MGRGFSYIGREVRIMVGKKEKLMDMLFFNYITRCFVVLEIKAGDFESPNTIKPFCKSLSLTFNFNCWSYSESELARICSLNTLFRMFSHLLEKSIQPRKIAIINAINTLFSNNFNFKIKTPCLSVL